MRAWCSIISTYPDSPWCASARKSFRPMNRRDHWIDVAGGRRPDRTDHHEWREPTFAIFRDSSGEITEIHLQIVVHRYRAHRPAPEPGHVRDLVERVMGLACHVDRRLSGEALQSAFAIVRKCPSQRDDDRGEIRLRSTAGEARDGVDGEAELTREPRQCVSFDLVRRR